MGRGLVFEQLRILISVGLVAAFVLTAGGCAVIAYQMLRDGDPSDAHYLDDPQQAPRPYWDGDRTRYEARKRRRARGTQRLSTLVASLVAKWWRSDK